nr:immunoglobulin light chain junction region [Macaca mulatta]
CLQSVEFPFTF